MLGQRRRRCTNVKPTLIQRFVSVGKWQLLRFITKLDVGDNKMFTVMQSQKPVSVCFSSKQLLSFGRVANLTLNFTLILFFFYFCNIGYSH